MISHEKQWDNAVARFAAAADKSIDALKTYLQTFSAIVGGTIWLSMQKGAAQHASLYAGLSDLAAWLIWFVTTAMVIDNLRSWHAYRSLMSELGGTDSAGKPHIPRPRLVPSATTEIAMLAGILVVSIIFTLFNPFLALAPQP